MEKCMVTASIAFLLCHPNSSINCSNPCKQKSPSPNKLVSKNPQEERKPTTNPNPILKPHKIEHSEATTTQLRLVYNHLGSSHYQSIQALENILRRGWGPKKGHSKLVIDKVLKVKHKEGFVEKFESYREMIKGKGLTNIDVQGVVGEEEINVNRYYNNKLKEDGFELLCFIGAKLACKARVSEGVESVCRKRYCGVCRMIRVIESSSLESLHSLSVSENAWMAHKKAVRECGDEQGCRKAVVICRVIGGRIADHRQWSMAMGEDTDEFDSVFVPVMNGSDSQDELLVFNPSAILPCFVILYDVEV